MNNEMSSLLNLAYEIEGLLLLLINRGDEASADMKQLLRKKVSCLAMALGEETENLPESDVTAEQEPSSAEELTEIQEENVLTEEATAVAESGTTATEAMTMAEGDTAIEEAAITDAEIAENLTFEEKADANLLPSSEEEAAVNPQPEEAVANSAPAVCEPPAPITLEEKVARENATDFSKAFTLNDKFRFIRELFNGSEQEFADAVSVIQSMNSIEEAEEYFYDDLCWDPQSSEVKEFMEIVARHF